MPVIETWTRQLLALLFGSVFVYAGVLKLKSPFLFQQSIRSFELLPDPFSAWLALSLPWLEVFAGAAIVIGVMRQGGLLLLNLSLVMFFVALGSAWHRGLNIDCGCFGGGETPDYTSLFVRDALLLTNGLFVMWLEHRRQSRPLTFDL
jgi:uncharacterized membrane protein YphA (DoxX/SURF4 family)